MITNKGKKLLQLQWRSFLSSPFLWQWLRVC